MGNGDEVKWMKISDDLLFKFIGEEGIPETLATVKDLVARHVSKYPQVGNVDVKKLLDILQDHEGILYMANKRYRDHVYHSIRLGISGEMILDGEIKNTKEKQEKKVIATVGELIKRNPFYYKLLDGHGIETEGEDYHKFLLGVWYLASIVHDLGYVFEAYLQIRDSISLFKNFRPMREFSRRIEDNLDQLEKELGKVLPVNGPMATEIESKLSPSIPSAPLTHERISAAYAKTILGDVVDPRLEMASRMILLHNPNPQHEVRFSEEPLAYLMAILDETQEWKRSLVNKESALAVFQGQPDTGKLTVTELPAIYLASDSTDSFLWNIDKHDNKLCFYFRLDYDDEVHNLLNTGFNFPLAAYSKQRAISRLKTGSLDTLKEVFNELLGVPLNEFNLNNEVEIICAGNLSQEWNKQVKLLRVRAKDENNGDLFDFAKTLTKTLTKGTEYPSDTKTISLSSKTKIFVPAGLEKVMADSFELYGLEKEIQQNKITQHLTLSQKKENKDLVVIDGNFEWDLVNPTNPLKGIPQVVTSIGNLDTKEPPEILSVRIGSDTKNYKDDASAVLLEKIDPERFDSFAMIFDFRKLPPKTPFWKEMSIKFDFSVIVPKNTLWNYYITNTRRNDINSLEIEVKFEKELFDSMFIGGIKRTVPRIDWGNNCTEKLISDLKQNLELGMDLLPDYVPLNMAEKADNEKFYIFSEKFANVKPYMSPGWLWVPKSPFR